jgi:hypothetical protein
MMHQHSIIHAAFSPDGSLVLTEAGFWDAATGKRVSQPLQMGRRPVFSEDGRRVVTSTDDKAQVWEFHHPDWPAGDAVSYAELVSALRLDDGGGAQPLTAGEWQDRFSQLSHRYPQEFLGPPGDSLLAAELERTPVDPARLRMYGESFYRRGQPAGAVRLLENARASGADVDPLLLARCYWLAGQLDLAAREFERAIGTERDTDSREYLRHCLAAVRREAAEQPDPK